MSSEKTLSEGQHGHGEHERSDVNIRGIVWFTIGFTLVLVVVHFLLVAYLGLDRTGRIDHQTERVVRNEKFRGPNLQENPHADLNRFKAAQISELESYRWVDRKQGIVGVPVSEAMNKLAAEGLNAAEAKRPKKTEASGEGAQP